MKVLVINPNTTQSMTKKIAVAAQAVARPDTEIIAAMIRIIINEQLYDSDFVTQEAEGFDELRHHVRHFTPDTVAERA